MAPKKHPNSEEPEEDNNKKQKITHTHNVPATPASAPVIARQDPAAPVRTWGNLSEAVQVTSSTSAESRASYERRWRHRLALAQLSFQPEGFQFVILSAAGEPRTHTLLSPPHLVAVRNEKGRWRRRDRDEESDGPAPYTEAFYQDYLASCMLPPWFFRVGHLAMLRDADEALFLGVALPTLPETAEMPAMPSNLARPTPLEVNYRIDVGDIERQYLSGRFPGVLAAMAFHTYVLPSGHVVLHSTRASDEQVEALVLEEDQVEWEFGDANPIQASYKLEGNVTPVTQSAAQTSETRRRRYDAHIDDGGIVNPMEIPAGLGEWRWFSDSDEELALADGFQDPQAVTDARGAGAILLGHLRQDVASVVYFPEREFLNPAEEPKGTGRWEFLTSNGVDSDAERAALNFGGAHRLPNRPTASQIFRLRQLFQDEEGREDLTRDIRLVWIPSDEAVGDEGDDPELTPLPTPSASPQPTPRTRGELQTVHLPGPKYQCDPTNGDPGGNFDQTGRPGKHRYYTGKLPGQERDLVITIDRARPQVGLKEEHKTWCYTKRGWEQYHRHGQIDWNDKEQLGAVARWRDQKHRREGWPNLREEARETYSKDERDWVFERVKASCDANQMYDTVQTYKDFLEKFKGRAARTEAGVSSLMLRLKREYLASKGEVKASGQTDEQPEPEHSDSDDPVNDDLLDSEE